MRVFTQANHLPFELGMLVASSVTRTRMIKVNDSGKYRNEFYMNKDGKIVWDLYSLGWSDIVPVASQEYEVVPESAFRG